MLIVLSVVVTIALVGFVILGTYGYRNNRENAEIAGTVLAVISGIGLCVALGFLFCYTADISTAHTIDSKIVMYEEENAKIEEKINTTVANYLKHEQETLTNLNPENAMAILAAYPELKSDTLVASQVEKYISNTEELKSLKESKIDIAKKKWWVYFGS